MTVNTSILKTVWCKSSDVVEFDDLNQDEN